MKNLLLLSLLYTSFLTARSQQEELCIDNQSDLEDFLFQNSDNQTTLIEEAEKAFVPDIYNASSFRIPRLVYILFTCDSTEGVVDIIDKERAFVWASEYLFVYMHPAVLRLVSLLDITPLGPSIHTLRWCIPRTCSNATGALNLDEAILKVCHVT